MSTSRQGRRKKIIAFLLVSVLLLGAVGTGVYRYNRPLPTLEATLTTPTVEKQVVALPWTESGESAISTASNKVLGVGENANKVVPTASIAKLITILTVLKKYPLSAGQSGPTITLADKDVAIYNKYNSEDGSAALVTPGEQISEYQMLQAMLLPSANNIADSLAIWAYGSLSAYRSAAQDTVNTLGMGSTKVGSDASGFLPDTVSTANDLVLLGEAALKQDVVKEIAAQRVATIPVEGVIYNTNPVLGQSGITGLKTGTSDEAGNCFLFSATHTFDNGQSETFVGVVLNSPTAQSRYSEAVSLLNATYGGYKEVLVASANQPIGRVASEWGQSTAVAPKSDVSEFVWLGDATTTAAKITLDNKSVSLKEKQTVGSITVGENSVSLIAAQDVKPPSLWWRIFH